MASGGRVCNPNPQGPWPDEKPTPRPGRSLAGLSALEEFTPLLRRPTGDLGRGRADRGIGRSDGGNGRQDRLRENFPRGAVILLDFFPPAERLTGLARLLDPQDEDPAEDPTRPWCQLLKDEGGVLLAAVLRPGDGPRRVGRKEAVSAGIGYLERQAHRREDPDYLARGWCIGRGAGESAGQTVVGPRRKLAGRRGSEAGAHAGSHLRALDRSAKGQWDAFWRRDFTPN